MTVLSFDGVTPSIDESAFVAPGATIIGRVTLGRESSIWFQCVARGDINSITIGEQTNIQDGCMLHVTHRYGLVVKNRVTVGHGAILHGCHIEDDSLIAMGAIVLDGAIIGAGSLVAAGTLVPPRMDVPAGSLVMGSPGKVIRQLTQEDRERAMKGWKNYVGYAQAYKTQLGSEV